jgi:beta-aspartyl-peptidase (threonine type)
MKPSLIIHGGAWSIPDEAVGDCRAGCRRALEVGWKILERGGSAMGAVEAAIVVLEDDPTFDAGVGSHLNRDGRVELDAMLMDGATLKAGAVAAVERVRNPIRLARRVLESCEHMMLVGAGAEQFAVEQGLPLCSPEELVIERERAAWSRCIGTAGHQSEFHLRHRHGTVGAVALDRQGGLVAGTSTGGTCCKRPGRVGDSPLVGCGCYADVEAGGVSCTGWGEAIMKIVMAKTAVDFLRRPAEFLPARLGESLPAESVAQDAARACVRVLAERAHGTGGLILLDRDGRPGVAFNTPRMAYAYMSADLSIVAAPQE